MTNARKAYNPKVGQWVNEGQETLTEQQLKGLSDKPSEYCEHLAAPCEGPHITKADIAKQALQQETAININREADILRGTSVYMQVNNFIEYYGILYFLRVIAQAFADRFKEDEHYNDLVGTTCSLYSLYSTIALRGE